MTTILLLGKDGQLGWELQRSLAPLGEIHAVGRAEGDLCNHQQLKELITALNPDFIVNAAGYTAVDKAEDDQENCFAINRDALTVIGETAKQTGAWVFHYSTDYVFSGDKETPYTEQDQPSPLNVYGHSKWQGEEALRDTGALHLIFRTSWVFATKGKNFAKTMLELAKDRDTLQVVNDQFGAPTSAELIADITAQIMNRILSGKNGPEDSGIYHLAATGKTSWYDYAAYVFQLAREKNIGMTLREGQLQSIPSEAYPVRAKRPKNSALNTDKLKERFGIHLPTWQYHVKRLIDERII